MEYRDKVLILTPVKDAEEFLENYFQSLYQLTYPHSLISIGLLESDSVDNTYIELEKRLPELRKDFRSAGLWKKDFGFHIPPGTPRWAGHIQIERRAILAKSRNHLLFHALNDENWVLWLDVDVVEYPSDIIERLLEVRKDIVQPNCVKQYSGISFDLNAWRDKGRLHLHDLKGEGNLVRLHSVGGTMLLIKADIHRDGLIFPPFLYGRENPLIRGNNYFHVKREIIKTVVRNLLEGIRKMSISQLAEARRDVINILKGGCTGEIETEGLGMMAHDMGYECWGMPNLEIRHRDS
jgi:glycosyltransferase involved in cell wall biosynthesis